MQSSTFSIKLISLTCSCSSGILGRITSSSRTWNFVGHGQVRVKRRVNRTWSGHWDSANHGPKDLLRVWECLFGDGIAYREPMTFFKYLNEWVNERTILWEHRYILHSSRGKHFRSSKEVIFNATKGRTSQKLQPPQEGLNGLLR